MNYSTAVMLMNDNIKCVRTIYKHEDDKPHNPVLYKTFDHSLKVGDLIIVPTDTRHKRTVVKIIEINVEPDFDSNIKIDWVIGKVDEQYYASILEQEAKMIEVIKESEKRKKREQMKENILAMHADDIKALPIVSVQQPAALPATE